MPSASCYFSMFLSSTEKQYRTESKRNETFAMIFLGLEDIQRTWSVSRGSHEATTRTEGTPRGVGRAPTIVGTSWLHRPISSAYIFSNIPKPSRGATKPLFHRHNFLYLWDPILGPFWVSCRRGIRSRRASTSTPLPLRWSVSSLPHAYGSRASS